MVIDFFPRTFWSRYESGGKKYFHIWKQWFGKIYHQAKFEIKE